MVLVASNAVCDGALPFSAGARKTRRLFAGNPTLLRLMEKAKTSEPTSNPTKSTAASVLRGRSHLCLSLEGRSRGEITDTVRRGCARLSAWADSGRGRG